MSKINKPQGWDTTETRTIGEGFSPLPAGNYTCKISGATYNPDYYGREVIEIEFDVAAGEHKDYYKKRAEGSSWGAKPYAMQRLYMDGKALAFFKGTITALEGSNPGYKWDFDSDSLRGKLFLGRFGAEEYVNKDGELKAPVKLQIVGTIGKEYPVLEIKRLSADKYPQLQPATAAQFPVDDSFPF